MHLRTVLILFCVLICVGPTAILALLINRYVGENRDFATFLSFINGAMIFLFGMLNLGFLVQFISIPVRIEEMFILLIAHHKI